jgi:glycerophosphoryl diester phosphodiesterase
MKCYIDFPLGKPRGTAYYLLNFISFITKITMKTVAAILISLFLASTANVVDPEVDNSFMYVGHRGASYLAPENTLASIHLAWELGADAAECDVMLTSDYQVVLFHDKNTKKLTGEAHVVSETPWGVLSKLKVKLRETNLPAYEGERIPLLADILSTIPADRMLVIEIKTGPEILPFLKEVIEQHWKSGKICFIAFDFKSIQQAKILFQEVPCYYLSSSKSDVNKRFDAIVESRLDGVDLRHPIIDKSLMNKCKDAGLDVWCWTVNDPETAWKMKSLGVTAVTTDRPQWLKEQLLLKK